MPTKHEMLEVASSWSTPAEVRDRVGGRLKMIHVYLRICVARGWAESRFTDGRGTEFRALPGWQELAGPDPRLSQASWGVVSDALEERGPMTVEEVRAVAGSSKSAARKMLERRVCTGVLSKRFDPDRGLLVYTLSKTVSEEAQGMGEDKDKDKTKSKPPYPSREAEECENDVRNEP